MADKNSSGKIFGEDWNLETWERGIQKICDSCEALGEEKSEYKKKKDITMIRLEEVTPENWRYDLKVAESQKSYVSDSMRLLARAYAYRNYNSVAFVIYNDDTPVGTPDREMEEDGIFDYVHLEKTAALRGQKITHAREITPRQAS